VHHTALHACWCLDPNAAIAEIGSPPQKRQQKVTSIRESMLPSVDSVPMVRHQPNKNHKTQVLPRKSLACIKQTHLKRTVVHCISSSALCRVETIANL
jgi:hypothetical protein